jgi:hypothetical protein
MRRASKLWTARIGAILMAAAIPLALVTSPASAVDGSVSSRVWTSPTIQPDANDPGGRVTGYLNFNSRYTMHVEDVTLKDICPGDGHLVYWFLEVDYTLENHGYKGPKHYSEGTCDSPSEHWNSLGFETTTYQIQKARLWVCVNTDEGGGIDLNGDNDACNQSSWRDNPYT